MFQQSQRLVSCAQKEERHSDESNSANEDQKESKIPTELNLKLLSWNIDGLHNEKLEERTRAVVETILSKKPHAVLLQEVVEDSLEVLKNECDGYKVLVHDEHTFSYFNAILVRSSCLNMENLALEYMSFVNSEQGRHFLVYPIKFSGANVILMTSHFESLKDYSPERKSQLREILLYMRRRPNNINVIFGGDTNLRDKEINAIGGLPNNVFDAWVSCGSPRDAEFTWDMGENDNLDFPDGSKPKLRFDRVFLRPAQNGKVVKPNSFTLIGKQRLSCGRFASDHWGIWLEFSIE